MILGSQHSISGNVPLTSICPPPPLVGVVEVCADSGNPQEFATHVIAVSCRPRKKEKKKKRFYNIALLNWTEAIKCNLASRVHHEWHQYKKLNINGYGINIMKHILVSIHIRKDTHTLGTINSSSSYNYICVQVCFCSAIWLFITHTHAHTHTHTQTVLYISTSSWDMSHWSIKIAM